MSYNQLNFSLNRIQNATIFVRGDCKLSAGTPMQLGKLQGSNVSRTRWLRDPMFYAAVGPLSVFLTNASVISVQKSSSPTENEIWMRQTMLEVQGSSIFLLQKPQATAAKYTQLSNVTLQKSDEKITKCCKNKLWLPDTC